MPEIVEAEVQLLDRSYRIFGWSNDMQFHSIRKNGWHVFNLEHLRHLVKRDSICIDIGAYAGIMALAMHQLAPDGEVHAFEGDSHQFVALSRTLAQYGVSAKQAVMGKGNLIEWISDWTSSHALPSDHGIRTQRLDDYDLGKPVNLLKIDAEGAELDILEGARDLLSKSKPIVLLEFNSFAFLHYRNLLPSQALEAIFAQFPYVYYFKDRNRVLRELTDRSGFLAYNYLHGLVDDLLCSYLPISLPEPAPLGTMHPPSLPEPVPVSDSRTRLRRILSKAAARIGI